ncbi:MAG TPA: hypothetical protein VJ808_02910 [Gemmatimonadales bacterium]|nr:hypothetical protein [Gemmatimonadales bacterium]
MFLTIRRYSPRNGAITKASLQLLRRQLHDEFLPVLRKVPGFSGYYVVSVGDRELITLTFCETPEGSGEASRCSAEYTFRNPLVFELGRPEVTEGEVLAFDQSAADAIGEPGNGGGAAAAALALWFEESRAMLLTPSEQ